MQASGLYLGVHTFCVASLKAPKAEGAGVKCENRGRQPRFSFKGGEEKSPYSANFSTRCAALLDGERTIPLLLCDKVEGSDLGFFL